MAMKKAAAKRKTAEKKTTKEKKRANPNVWTAAQVKCLKTNYKKMTAPQIAKTLKRTVNAVRAKAATLGLKKTVVKKKAAPKKKVVKRKTVARKKPAAKKRVAKKKPAKKKVVRRKK